MTRNEIEVIVAKLLFIEAFRKIKCHRSYQKEIQQKNTRGKHAWIHAQGLQGLGMSCAVGLPL